MSQRKQQPDVGVVGIADGWSSRRLVEEIIARTGRCRLIDMADVAYDLASGIVLHDGVDLSRMSGLIVKKLGKTYCPEMLDRLGLLDHLNVSGLPVFSRPAAIGRLLNRISCTLVLRRGDIPMPETVITESALQAAQAVRRFGRAVLKPLYSTKARGMKVLGNGSDLNDDIEAFRAEGNPVFYVQRLIPLPGQDLGLVFLGGRFVGAYARIAQKGSWNTCIANGGRYAPIEPDDDLIELARRAQALFDLDFTCVDVAETPDGPVVFEVSAFGGFRGLHEAHGIDAAALFTDYCLERLSHGR